MCVKTGIVCKDGRGGTEIVLGKRVGNDLQPPGTLEVGWAGRSSNLCARNSNTDRILCAATLFKDGIAPLLGVCMARHSVRVARAEPEAPTFAVIPGVEFLNSEAHTLARPYLVAAADAATEGSSFRVLWAGQG